MARNGKFVVVWSSVGSSGPDSSFLSVVGQRYAADGSPRGGELQVNTYTTGAQRSASGQSRGDDPTDR
ncbi:MAG: hypothetical protein GY856_17085 [bacterium]|nr:hypothetical protein [bacterium]